MSLLRHDKQKIVLLVLMKYDKNLEAYLNYELFYWIQEAKP